MELIERNFISTDWITLTFLAGLVMIALMKLYKPQLLLGYSIAFFSQGFIESRSDKNPSIFTVFHVLIFLFSLLVFSLTLHLLISNFMVSYNFSYLYTLAFTTLFIMLKYILVKLIVITLKIEEITRYFLFSKTGYLYAISLWLYPILVLYQYSYFNDTFLIIYILLLLAFRVFLITKNNKKLIFNHFFYFILYFCTLELAPLLIIYKTTTI
ncbi:DUF4271 domain-containing protein [Tenacibaculum jejuense]|uniref:DUF4271 domain-containing protein n=1 Tax=Tenacibaculum jejuense TaxID=584609 RepID=A0A238U4B5_9FLAO|nr:DUF4271 domain-containing protein [Tenacibaculum jejuense]SNR14051.1 conserved membrane protein of unknown function [Tenacibaculum jejuense]